jgi:ABC-2 type transport system permease protein
MKQILIIAYYELLRLIRHRTLFFLIFVMPLLVIFILGSALSAFFVNKPVQPGSVRLALLMEDDGFIRASMDRLLAGGELGDVEVLPVRSRSELKASLDRGEADAGLAVPAGFSESLRSGMQPEWELKTGSNALKSVITIQVIHAFFDGWNLRFAESGGWKDGSIPLDVPVHFQADMSSRTDYVKLSGWNGTQETYSALQYYSAHMLIMFMLYSGMTAAVNLVISKEDHTLARMRSQPVATWRILAGNVAGQSAVILLQVSVIVACTALFYGVDWGGRLWLLLLVCLLIMLFTQSVAVIAGIIARRRQEVMILFQSGIILMTFLSGGFSPSIGETLSRFGTYTMTYWGAQSILRMMLHADLSTILGYVHVLAWWAAGAMAAAAAAYWRAGYHE